MRTCGDAAEKVNGQNNPNLVVVSYYDGSDPEMVGACTVWMLNDHVAQLTSCAA